MTETAHYDYARAAPRACGQSDEDDEHSEVAGALLRRLFDACFFGGTILPRVSKLNSRQKLPNALHGIGVSVCFTPFYYSTNVWMYPFWRVPERLVDVYKYYFFHTLSIMGGLVSGALDMSQHCIIAQYGRLNA